MYENQLAENLMHYRKKKGLSQEKVAEYMEVSRQAVSKWETNISKPSSDNLIKLAQLFEVDVDMLLGRGGRCKIINSSRTINRKNAGDFYRHICFVYICIYNQQCFNG